MKTTEVTWRLGFWSHGGCGSRRGETKTASASTVPGKVRRVTQQEDAEALRSFVLALTS